MREAERRPPHRSRLAVRALAAALVLLAASAAVLLDRALHYRAILEEQARQRIFQGAWLRAPESLRQLGPGAVVFLGDSLFENWNLGAAFGPRVVNLGRNGEKAAEVRERVGQALALAPRSVVLHAGLNDLDGAVLRGEPVAPIVARITAELRAAALEVRAAGAVPVLTTLLPVTSRFLLAHLAALPLPTPGRSDLARAAAAASASVRALAAELGVPLCDLEAVLRAPDGSRPRRFALPDGIHVSREGYALLAAALRRALPHLEAPPR